MVRKWEREAGPRKLRPRQHRKWEGSATEEATLPSSRPESFKIWRCKAQWSPASSRKLPGFQLHSVDWTRRDRRKLSLWKIIRSRSCKKNLGKKNQDTTKANHLKGKKETINSREKKKYNVTLALALKRTTFTQQK